MAEQYVLNSMTFVPRVNLLADVVSFHRLLEVTPLCPISSAVENDLRRVSKSGENPKKTLRLS